MKSQLDQVDWLLFWELEGTSFIPGSAIVFLWDLEQSHFISLEFQFPIWKNSYAKHLDIYRQKATLLLNTMVILTQELITGIKKKRILLNDRLIAFFFFLEWLWDQEGI